METRLIRLLGRFYQQYYGISHGEGMALAVFRSDAIVKAVLGLDGDKPELKGGQR